MSTTAKGTAMQEEATVYEFGNRRREDLPPFPDLTDRQLTRIEGIWEWLRTSEQLKLHESGTPTILAVYRGETHCVGEGGLQISWHDDQDRLNRVFMEPDGRVRLVEVWIDTVPYDPMAEEDLSEGGWKVNPRMKDELREQRLTD